MTVDSEDCGYVVYSYCTCEGSPHAGERCPYEFTDECPVFKQPIYNKNF